MVKDGRLKRAKVHRYAWAYAYGTPGQDVEGYARRLEDDYCSTLLRGARSSARKRDAFTIASWYTLNALYREGSPEVRVRAAEEMSARVKRRNRYG